jgi:hypothetical protein
MFFSGRQNCKYPNVEVFLHFLLADKIASIQMWKACDFFSAKQNCEFLNAEVLLSLVPPTQQKRQQ